MLLTNSSTSRDRVQDIQRFILLPEAFKVAQDCFKSTFYLSAVESNPMKENRRDVGGSLGSQASPLLAFDITLPMC